MKFFDFQSERRRRSEGEIVGGGVGAVKREMSGRRAAMGSRKRDAGAGERTGSVFAAATGRQATSGRKRLGSGCRKREPLIVRVWAARDRPCCVVLPAAAGVLLKASQAEPVFSFCPL